MRGYTLNRCVRCIMDQSDPNNIFDEHGVCNHCHNFDRVKKIVEQEKKKKSFDFILNEIKQNNKNKKYDCILGLSGGVDSSYLLHLAVKSGLRVLVVHVDAGWNSDTAVSNIHKLCSKLNVELHTIVVDWPTMKELQRAYMFSGLPNLDVPQDHAFLAATMKFARKYSLKYMLNGSNIATEGILPSSWGYDAMDLKQIKDVFKKHKRKGNLINYPKIGLINYLRSSLLNRVNLLNYVDYSKKAAIDLLQKEYGWEYYGGKHFESRFTKFFQSYFLPLKHGYDKRLAHISSLIVGGEITRDEGLDIYENNNSYNQSEIDSDKEYILKKLNLSEEEWDKILKTDVRNEFNYKNQIKEKTILKKIYSLTIKKLKNE